VKCSTGREKPAMRTSICGVCGSSPLDCSLNLSGKSSIHCGAPDSSPLETIAAQTIFVPSASGGTTRSNSAASPARSSAATSASACHSSWNANTSDFRNARLRAVQSILRWYASADQPSLSRYNGSPGRFRL
jgi:hypothetical protein